MYVDVLVVPAAIVGAVSAVTEHKQQHRTALHSSVSPRFTMYVGLAWGHPGGATCRHLFIPSPFCLPLEAGSSNRQCTQLLSQHLYGSPHLLSLTSHAPLSAPGATDYI